MIMIMSTMKTMTMNNKGGVGCPRPLMMAVVSLFFIRQRVMTIVMMMNMLWTITTLKIMMMRMAGERKMRKTKKCMRMTMTIAILTVAMKEITTAWQRRTVVCDAGIKNTIINVDMDVDISIVISTRKRGLVMTTATSSITHIR